MNHFLSFIRSWIAYRRLIARVKADHALNVAAMRSAERTIAQSKASIEASRAVTVQVRAAVEDARTILGRGRARETTS